MADEPEITVPAKNPATRQVLVNIGNRYVVFGTRSMLARHRVLGPKDVHQRFSERVADEYDFPTERLVQSVIVDGAEVRHCLTDDYAGDLEVMFSDGTRSVVEIKIRYRDFNKRDYDRHLVWLRTTIASHSETAEVWIFNIERLRLTIMTVDNGGLPQFATLEPLNIWEFNQDGSTFERAYVVERVDEWASRIDKIYADVKEWLSDVDITVDTSRAVIMSEELMQKFGVPDRELPILDISMNDVALLSFVPVGLWILGSNGRIDIISQDGTSLLLDTARQPDPPQWSLLIDRANRARVPWNKRALLDLLKVSQAA